MNGSFRLFSGTANTDLAIAIAGELGTTLGACSIDRFPDGELTVQYCEPVRRREVVIVQSLCPPVNDHLVELLAFADAARRAAAERIVAVVPYFAYARADKRHGRREPVTARMVADLFQAVGIDHVVTVDLHVPQIEGFFHIPLDGVTAVPALSEALVRERSPDLVVVAPDAGAVKLASEYAHHLETPVIVLHKRRETGTQTKVTHLVGDVRGKTCVIVDDMISTGGTIAESLHVLREAGARPEIRVAATHGLLTPEAHKTLIREGVRQILVTDTLPTSFHPPDDTIKVVSMAPVLARALQHFLSGGC